MQARTKRTADDSHRGPSWCWSRLRSEWKHIAKWVILHEEEEVDAREVPPELVRLCAAAALPAWRDADDGLASAVRALDGVAKDALVEYLERLETTFLMRSSLRCWQH